MCANNLCVDIANCSKLWAGFVIGSSQQNIQILTQILLKNFSRKCNLRSLRNSYSFSKNLEAKVECISSETLCRICYTSLIKILSFYICFLEFLNFFCSRNRSSSYRNLFCLVLYGFDFIFQWNFCCKVYFLKLLLYFLLM